MKTIWPTIDVDGVQREASLLLLEDAEVGDYVIVHAGFAIQRIDEKAALETLALLKEAAEFIEKMEDHEISERESLTDPRLHESVSSECKPIAA